LRDAADNRRVAPPVGRRTKCQRPGRPTSPVVVEPYSVSTLGEVLDL
jgi:hypothetical protein